MNVGRRSWSRRVLTLLSAVTAAAAAAVALSSLVATRAAATAASQPSPVVDPDYLYGQLYDMAGAYSYRISGADGPPQNPSDPFNLAPPSTAGRSCSGTGRAS